MDDHRVADYFVVAGLPDNPLPLEEYSNEAILKPTYKQDPITDVAVINRSLSEKVPKGFTCIERTPLGFPADLNHGSIRCSEMYMCYRRSRDKPPLTDIGILYEGKERLMTGCEVVHTTPFGNPANVNNSNSSRIYITYRRASENAASDTLTVVDIAIILTNKGETPPHAYCMLNKILNKGMVGSDVYLCYKKAMTNFDVLAYKPAILDRYPAEDYIDFPLPVSVPMFCLPMGATMECWSAKAQHPLPVFSTFVLTGSAGEKVYGAAVTFYEEFMEDKLTDLQMRHLGLKNKHIREQYRILKTVHSNKCICLLSHWPFFDAFKKFLSYLYRISITGPHLVPLERHISHFMFHVPYPSPQRPRILVQLNHEAISLSMPEDSPLTQSGASFITLLKNLGPENCMSILLYVLLEHKILVHSLRPAVLTGVAEAISTIIFPFHWQCPYIPLCPLGLSDYLNAPCPFIIGIDSRYFDLYDPPPDVICVDLDTIRIWLPDDKKSLSSKLLPKKPAKVLLDSLHRLFDQLCEESVHQPVSEEVSLEMGHFDHDFKLKRKEIKTELLIQEAFLRFGASLMKGYKQFLKPITKAPTLRTTDAFSLFDMQGFLKSRDKANTKFFTQMMKTQMFIRFIEERSFVSDKDASLAFFDECTEKVEETKDEPKLIEVDESSQSERTVFITPPEPVGLPEGVKYSYNGFPQLASELFLRKNPSELTIPGKPAMCPNSPMAKRTKQEIRTSQKMAQQQVGTPALWAKCLRWHCYGLWFIHLPGFVHHNSSKERALQQAYNVVRKMQSEKLQQQDEVCYRVLLQLCGQYNLPVLAVKVYYEMKRAGIHPNAITYGYYNKAVLEGTWPTSLGKGCLMWKKLRNVIIGVAQFRRAVRRRSLSICSNSGSEYDKMSIDSYLEDTIPEKPEIVKADSKSINDERLSTGGASDRGYNSMTQEDARKISQVLSSSGAESEHTEKSTSGHRSSLRFSFRRKKKKENCDDTDSSGGKSDIGSVNTKHPATPVNRSGSIVRRSLGSSDSHDSLKGSIIENSSAGLLMVSQTSLDNSVFLHGDKLIDEADKKRRRHRSAGDNHIKVRSNSLFSSWHPRHSSGDNGIAMRYSDLVNREKENILIENIKESDLSKKSKIHSKDSGVVLDDSVTADVVRELESTHLADCDVTELSDTSSKSSPSHSLRVPVTENDPLGLFREDLVETNMIEGKSLISLSPVHSPNHQNNVQLVSSTPFADSHTDKAMCDDASQCNMNNNNSESGHVNKLSESDSLSDKCSDTHGDLPAIEKIDPKHRTIGRTNSSPDCLGTTEKFKISNLWSVKEYFSSPQSPHKQPSSVSLDETSKHENPEDMAVHRGGSLKRHNEALSGFLKYASSAVANKFNELKQSIQSPSKFGSSSSLGKSLDESDGYSSPAKHDQSKNLSKKYSGSLDLLSSDSSRDTSSDDIKAVPYGSAPSPSYLDQYIPLKDFPENKSVHFAVSDSVMNKVAVEVEMSSCCRCNHCRSLLYDEELLAGWSADHSNLNTSCHFCSSKLVPQLQIYIKDWRCKRSSVVASSPGSGTETNGDSPWYIAAPDSSPNPPQYNRSTSQCSSLSGTDNLLLGGEDEVEASCEDDENGLPPVTLLNNSELSNGCPLNRHSGTTGSSPRTKRSVSMEESPWTKSETAVESPWKENFAKGANNLPYMDIDDLSLKRRCASECLTTATDNMSFCSSMESTDGLGVSLLRSPLSISIDEDAMLPTNVNSHSNLNRDIMSRSSSSVDPITVQYLSPLVLRKELENILDSEGDLSLCQDTFLDEHPIIFWNLVWYFKRIHVPSNLPGFLLTSGLINKQKVNTTEYTSDNVMIRLLWDNVRIHQEVGLPMYMAWNAGHSSTTVDALLTEPQPFNRAMMHQVITNIQRNDVLTPIKLIMNARRRKNRRKSQFRSIYREVLFLVLTACGKDNIDLDAFDREYKLAFSKLSQGEIRRLQANDKPRSSGIHCCRRAFGHLDV